MALTPGMRSAATRIASRCRSSSKRARKVDNSIAYHDVNKADRSPWLGLELGVEPLANGRIAGRPRLCLCGNTRQRVQQIGAGYDADELTIARHEHTFNLVALHEMDDILERGILGHRSYIRSHHVADLAAARLHVLGRKAPRTHQKFDPPRAFALGPG